MAIDPHFIPAFSIETVMLDKDTGAPLSGGIVSFFEDNQRTQLKAIYQITGNSPAYTYTPLLNPMTLSSIGTFVDALGNPVVPYFYPYVENDETGELDVDYYFVEVTSSGLVPQFTREAVPYIPNMGGVDDIESVLTNTISNPQFARVLFDTTITNSATYTFTSVTNQVFAIAPDWDLIVTCPSAGSITVAQVTPSGAALVVTNPATLLNIKSSGITNLLLRQRLYGTPSLWGATDPDVPAYISASFIGKSYTGTALNLGLYYSQSSGTVVGKEIVAATLTADGNYNPFYGSIALPISDNTQSFPNAYVDIYFQIPTTSAGIDISSVVVVGTGPAPIDNVLYDQVPIAREVDQLYNYYDPQIRFKAIPSLLKGWDFPLNPRQFAAQQANTTTPGYVLDQTIIQSAVANLTIAAAAGSNALQITTTAGDEAFYLLQYLDGDDALKTTMSYLSANLNAFANQNNVTVQITMYYSSGNGTVPSLVPMSPALPTTIGTITYSAGLPVFTLSVTPGTWTIIPQLGGNTNTAAVPATNGDVGFLGYNGLTNYASASTTNFYAIVVAFACPTSGTQININSVSCVPGLIATRPAPSSFAQTLQDCQYYWETSYQPGVAPGTAAGTAWMGAKTYPQNNISGVGAVPTGFCIEYNTIKRVVPTMYVYSITTGTLNKVTTVVMVGGTPHPADNVFLPVVDPFANGNWGASYPATPFPITSSVKTIAYLPQNSTGLVAQTGGSSISLHYIADARLGVI